MVNQRLEQLAHDKIDQKLQNVGRLAVQCCRGTRDFPQTPPVPAHWRYDPHVDLPYPPPLVVTAAIRRGSQADSIVATLLRQLSRTSLLSFPYMSISAAPYWRGLSGGAVTWRQTAGA